MPPNLSIVNPSEWKRGDYQTIALLRHSAVYLEEHLGIRFYDDVEDGLGKIKVAGLLLLHRRQFALIQYLQGPGGFGTEIHCLYDQAFHKDLDEVLEAMEMTLSDLAMDGEQLVIHPEVKFEPHKLIRQDDHGNRTVVGTFRCRADAAKQLKTMEAFAHKQTFWIQGEDS